LLQPEARARIALNLWIAAIVVGGVERWLHEPSSAVLHREDDLYVAECLEVGTVSQGYTIEEAVLNLKEANEFYLEEFPSFVQH
jgi:predicted RNase H-like HicB family nuclease